MKGQWLGKYAGSTAGTIILNLDEEEEAYEGICYLHPTDGPRVEVMVRLTPKANNGSFRTISMVPLDPDSLAPVNWEVIRAKFPGGTGMSTYADVEYERVNDALSLKWKTDIGLEGSATLAASQAGAKSELKSENVTWQVFKERVARLKMQDSYLFRGQCQPWRLRTAFHRHGRADLRRFQLVDVPELYKHLVGKMKHLLNLGDPQQNSAFLSLLQHHGYPTHLLDWTRSPYVAAFFAFKSVTPEMIRATPDARVRIFLFDAAKWSSFRGFYTIASPMLHVTLLDTLAIENDRLIPQQAIATISSVDDIESYISLIEDQHRDKGLVVLRALDLPITERETVMEELRFMGITAGSMMPGLEGACEEMKERHFRY